MAREPLYQSTRSADDEDRDLRPQRMQDMVGQRAVYARVGIAVDAASKRNEPLGHILFDGPPGLGKTTFATCLPRELNVPVVIRVSHDSHLSCVFDGVRSADRSRRA
jgi:Holliday junction DNA helicase RuvB